MVALGLLGTLDPRQSGGLEKIEGVPFAMRSAAQREEAEPVASTSSGAIPQGFARIERDADGNILRITLADGETIDPNASVANAAEEDEDDDADTPWGEPLNANGAGDANVVGEESDADEAPLDTRPRKQGIALTAGARPVQAKTAVAQGAWRVDMPMLCCALSSDRCAACFIATCCGPRLCAKPILTALSPRDGRRATFDPESASRNRRRALVPPLARPQVRRRH